MRTRVLSVILAASAAACAPSAPTGGPEPRGAGMEVDVPPVLALLGERERLSLTSEQVVALDSIARDWSRANDKLAGRKAKETGLVPMALSVAKGAVKSREKVAENNLRAARAVEQVLTAEQRQRVCELQYARGGAGELAAAPAGSRSLVSSSAPRRTRARSVWPWCAPSSDQSLAARQSES